MATDGKFDLGSLSFSVGSLAIFGVLFLFVLFLTVVVSTTLATALLRRVSAVRRRDRSLAAERHLAEASDPVLQAAFTLRDYHMITSCWLAKHFQHVLKLGWYRASD